ncbi:MAG: TonB family protein [Phycisphaerales bacterium]|nr:MAG: TonB family protein [Phycisphaerales bacterium]
MPKRYWIALPVALLANALLFCVLAGARREPSKQSISEIVSVRIAVMDWPSLNATEPEVSQAEPDTVPLIVRETSTTLAEAIPETTAALTMHLPSRMVADSLELPGLPVVLPETSDLRSLPGVPTSTIKGPLSLAMVDRAPRRTTGALPRYPQWARQARLEATVTLRFVVTSQGKVSNINIHRLEGDERLGREAMRAIAAWQFEPATKRGKPVACWCFQKVDFELDD